MSKALQVLDEFSEEFRSFLRMSVPSVDAAELLLALAADPKRCWHPAELAATLRPATSVGDDEARRYLDHFSRAGLLQSMPDGRVRYFARDEDTAAHVKRLSKAYRERPVTLFRLICQRFN